jgi:hypothetical protein
MSADGEHTMPDDRDDHDNVVVAGAICPMPDCAALVVAYRPSERAVLGRLEACEFTCPLCEIDFIVAEDELIFQSVPKGWLLASVHAA